MASVVHPHVKTDEFEMLQENASWSLDIELLAGEAVLVPPIGPVSSESRRRSILTAQSACRHLRTMPTRAAR
jgi:hypothetical protein